MLRNYLNVALRNFRRYKAFTAINVLGLALGLACCLIIALYVHHELSYDRFNEKADRIYRVVQEQRFATTQQVAVMSSPVAPALLSTFPEVEKAVRFYASKDVMRWEQDRLAEVLIAYTDSTVYDVFTLPLAQGNPSQALVAPNTVVLSEETARTLFGQQDAVGQSVQFGERMFEVTGVMANIPANAHFDFDAFASFATLDEQEELHSWGSNSMWTYVLLHPGVASETLDAKLPDFITAHIEREDALNVFSYSLQPLTSIHLHSQMVGEIKANNTISTIYIFSAIALFILIIASINYINLTTARSGQRLREVGIRKVLGAFRGQLVGQFLGESALLTCIGVVGALLITAGSLPYFNALLGIELTLRLDVVVTLVVVLLGVGVLAGIYPALHITHHRPVHILKGLRTASGRGGYFRRGLVVVQFTVSIALLVAVGVAMQQLQFIEQKDLGFDKEHLITLEAPGDEAQVALIKDALARLPEVLHVTASRARIGQGFPSTTFRREGAPEDEMQMVSYFDIDPNFVETMNVQLVAGRNFQQELTSDIDGSILINETAVHAFGWASAEEAIGQRITQGWTPEIIGVVKDFHFSTLHEAIDPLVLWWDPPSLRTLTVRTQPGEVSATLAALEIAWNDILPGRPFAFTFVDEHLNTLYKKDQVLSKLFGVFALFAIVIACLGLFGLTSFTYQQRKKEIGVRKVLGASVQTILTMLSREVLSLIAIAFVIALPLSYIAMKYWLAAFAYHVEPGMHVFLLAGLVTVFIALIAVSYQSIKASLSNPVKSLRFE